MNAVGGPVGGMPMMNNGVIGASRNNNQHDSAKLQLNTYIYDYLIKNELYDCARAFVNSDVPISHVKASPNRRRDADGNLNGVEDNSIDTDHKDDIDSKRPDDLPIPKVPANLPQNSFLQDWWCLFWDMYAAQRNKAKPGEGGPALQYVQHTQVSRSQPHALPIRPHNHTATATHEAGTATSAAPIDEPTDDEPTVSEHDADGQYEYGAK